MSTKKSVFLSDCTAEWVEFTTKKTINDQELDGPKWSECINATFEQFRYLLRDSLPELTADEWTVILNVYAGCYFPAHGVPARIASDMMDNIGTIDINDVVDDYANLVRKVNGMSQLEQMAVLYFVQIFWLNDWKMKEWDEIVLEICDILSISRTKTV